VLSNNTGHKKTPQLLRSLCCMCLGAKKKAAANAQRQWGGRGKALCCKSFDLIKRGGASSLKREGRRRIYVFLAAAKCWRAKNAALLWVCSVCAYISREREQEGRELDSKVRRGCLDLAQVVGGES
jgi:hypothetical protein